MRNCKFLRSACWAISLGFFVFAPAADAQNTYVNLAGEYSVIGNLPGDQVGSRVVTSASGGWVVWQDNATDGFGSGISARRLNSSLSGEFNSFQVNELAEGEQENPRAALLQDGGVAFVWQGGQIGFQDIYLRIADSEGLFQGSDIPVNQYVDQQQGNPTIATLGNGNLVVAWSSHGQDGSMQGIVARLFSPSGVALGNEFIVNQQTQFNQRDPQVVALSDGGVVLSWVSEKARTLVETNQTVSQHVVEVIGRIFDSNGLAVTDELELSAPGNICAHPALVATSTGGFAVGWSQLDSASTTNSWDVYLRAFNSIGESFGVPVRVNSHLMGDQFGIQLAAQATDVFGVWTSLRQDGSHEGVFGQRFTVAGVPAGSEFQVNTTTISKQMQPSIAADGNSRFLVVWSSFIGGANSFDLFAQRFVSEAGFNELYAPDAPYVVAIDSTQLSVTWPELSGYPVALYEVYVNSETAPIVTTNIHVVLSNLTPGSMHSVRLLYELADGRRSPLSSAAAASTWGADGNGDGLPDEWQLSMWGADPALWPNPALDSDGDGASNYAEFLAGTNPLDSGSVLRTHLHRSTQGLHFSWTSNPGFVYQVQSASSLNSWQNLGVPRFAHGTIDSISVTAGSGPAFYRVIRLR